MELTPAQREQELELARAGLVYAMTPAQRATPHLRATARAEAAAAGRILYDPPKESPAARRFREFAERSGTNRPDDRTFFANIETIAAGGKV